MTNFEKVFRDTLDKLEVDAKEVGLTLTSICRSTGVSRATPDRWRKQPPNTVEILTKMQGVVVAERERLAHEAKHGLHHD